MYRITLICTSHNELGKCNSNELHQIIESITPDVIFEELTPDLFDKLYEENQLPNVSPEVNSIKRYLQNRNIKHIPVDIVPSQDLPISDIKYMFETFKKYAAYKKLDDEQYKMTERDGFAFLNSEKCMELFEKKNSIEKYLIEFMMNKNRLFRIYKLLYEEADNRENAMLQNIYNYSKEHSYDKAIFTVGAGHRKSLLQKIQEYERKESFKLNWAFYGS